MNTQSIRLGLRANWQQFALLVLVNAFVGAMVGLERTLVPQIAAEEFDLASVSVTLSFIISFGIVKALTNLFAGRNADRWGRKPLLVAGWLIGLPVPLLVMVAPRWEWIIFANVLLGVNQGLCWSTAVIMKIDLVGKAGRGLAMGLNEFAGYLAMALSTVTSGWIASQTALRPYPFYMGIVFVVSGLLITLFWVHETIGHVQHEAIHSSTASESWGFGKIFRQVSWQDKTFFSLSQGGLVNNLNDVVIWGLLPLLALQKDLQVEQAATIGGVYLAVWGSSQLLTGPLSDRLGRKPLITGGLLLQSAGILLLALVTDYVGWLIAAGIMGIGTGMVYPTLLAAVSDVASPLWRASALGVYRLWRDSGYAFGALFGGILADLFTLQVAVVAVGLLTLASSFITMVLLSETLPHLPISLPEPDKRSHDASLSHPIA
ncbi:MAG: MFS transporter [Chloroflexota bacterium]|nr:MFS transporter [Chloroflexota bacterium]NOG65435.1 MFS transporter [Chloroflexota bacterium]GIK64348.1 MAG: MFS transporter [Chloroflexota bacterium]